MLLCGALLTVAIVVTSTAFMLVPIIPKPAVCESKLMKRQYASRYFRQVVQINVNAGNTEGDFQVATNQDLLAGSPSWNSASELHGGKNVSFVVHKHKTGSLYVVFESSTGIVLDSGKL